MSLTPKLLKDLQDGLFKAFYCNDCGRTFLVEEFAEGELSFADCPICVVPRMLDEGTNTEVMGDV
jgi:rubrerythrin